VANGGTRAAADAGTDEIEATGLCHISKVAMACQARLRDGRVVVGSIFVGGAR
jgi:hypothetical protein